MDLVQALNIFGIDEIGELDGESLKIVYRTLAKQKHPDRSGGNSMAFVELKEAYVFLQKYFIENPITASGSKKLKTLSKEELLENYYRDTRQLQLRLDFLETETQLALTQTEEQFDGIWLKFEDERSRLRHELESTITELQKKANRSLLQKILFFIPKMSQEEFWQRYNLEVDKYARLHSDLDLEFFKMILDLYGKSLNKIGKIVTKQEQNQKIRSA